MNLSIQTLSRIYNWKINDMNNTFIVWGNYHVVSFVLND